MIKSLFLILILVSSTAFAAVEEAFVLTSDAGVTVTVFRAQNQKPNRYYLLIQGVQGEWNGNPIEVSISRTGANKVDYNFESYSQVFTVLAGRGEAGVLSYSLAIQKPYAQYEGLRRPKVEPKIDLKKLSDAIHTSTHD